MRQFDMLLQATILLVDLLYFTVSSPLKLSSVDSILGLDAAPAFLPPSRDPWYSAPPGYEYADLGDILRIRVAPVNVTAATGANCSGGFQILYRTTNSLVRPAWAVTTILLPTPARTLTSNEGNSLLSYQIPYNSVDIDGSPSYILSSLDLIDLGNIQSALGMGWYVNVPDFEGPLGSFTEGLQSGYATLDSVRSLLSPELEVLGLGPSLRCSLWGYSGGALASEWAAELQKEYAPKINFVGAALGGLTPNIRNVLNMVTGTPFAGLAPVAILGMTSQFPDAYQFILDRLNPTGEHNKTTFLTAKNETPTQYLASFAGQDIYDYFICGEDDFNSPTISQLIDAQGIMGRHGTPQMPLFVYKAIYDETSPIADTDALVDQYCSDSVSIQYQRNTVGGHVAEETNGIPGALEYLSSVMAGKVPAGGCIYQNVAIDISSSPL
ncbi:MAG: hypothetical protein M1821_009460 [Bathelium mastoideum]|nr:MAG: hypothetical protein M1821_009460 [Bathelium mastoideum]KAI9688678.1 MAG: hypothetical protein M1822_001035 [Bathelium mastoideum]